jgi:hypothetical protein
MNCFGRKRWFIDGADIPASVDAVAGFARARDKTRGRRVPSPPTPSTLFSVPSVQNRTAECLDDGSRWSPTCEITVAAREGAVGLDLPLLATDLAPGRPAPRTGPAVRGSPRCPACASSGAPRLPSSRPTALDFQRYIFRVRGQGGGCPGPGVSRRAGSLRPFGRQPAVSWAWAGIDPSPRDRRVRDPADRRSQPVPRARELNSLQDFVAGPLERPWRPPGRPGP